MKDIYLICAEIDQENRRIKRMSDDLIVDNENNRGVAQWKTKDCINKLNWAC